ncbi:SPFH domain-containing protein [Chthonobacter albigriseus]|uniref:SPFH domain-containing protein n=1 Tax=Chthonobacter albigriseus TaxID=1683161 RepID=UPI0019D65CA0|nr:SPFH domain-containing protein [Chthonobacter albigriseus]
MGWIIVGFVLIVGGIGYFLRAGVGGTQDLKGAAMALGKRLIGLGVAAVGVIMVANTSFVFVAADQVGHLKRIYGFEELPPGHVVALSGQKGPQAAVLGPGFHFIPFVRVLYDYEEFPLVTVPEGFYGQITALDGAAMPSGMFMAPAIPDDRIDQMMDASAFLSTGGYRGPQETVLKPGSYRLNRYLFDVTINEATTATVVPAGQVGVVKSNVATPGLACREEVVAAEGSRDSDSLSVPLVPRGCVGIWKEPLLPGAYYLNRRAYEVELVDTRVQTWEFKGGYTKRIVDLSVDQQGKLQQDTRSVVEEVPSTAADRAVFVKIEGWDIPVELRVLVQVDPADAPIVVGSVGGLKEVEDRILVPAIRSIVRNVAGSNIRVPVRDADGTLISPAQFETRPSRVLDLIENREALEQTIETIIQVEGRKAGVDVREIRLGEPAIPPEILITRLRQQLADQLSNAYARETAAQNERIKTEQARATADEQPRLVESQIAVQVAQQREQEREALGRAERKFLEELAKGQSAQAGVLGQDRVAMLQALEKVLATLEKRPDIIQLVGRLVPQTLVTSGGGGVEGAAAVIGQAIQEAVRPQP